MTESDRSMNDVQALLEERRRYEAWLTALESRRDVTPPHVFERVQADYRSRLQQVADRLSGHRETIESERASTMSRLSLLEAEEQMRRDERTELDLRAHVGELGEPDAASAFSAVDDAMRQLAGEKADLQRRIDDLDALLAETPATPAGSAPPITQPLDVQKPPAHQEPSSDPQPASSFDELAFLNTVVGDEVADHASASPPPEADHSAAGQSTAAAESPPADPAYQRIVAPHETDAESLLAGLGQAGTGGTDGPPLAANVASNTPIVLRPSGSIEQSKTLRCNECGALNYPTEWYCERCGAELAAL